MRVLETSLEQDLSMFSRYLWQQQVRHRIFEERGRQVLEVADAGQADAVRSAYDAWRSGALRLESPAVGRPAPFSLVPLARLVRRAPVLAGLLALAIAVFPFSMAVGDGKIGTVVSWLTIVDLRQLPAADAADAPAPLTLLLGAEPWRWFTPVLLHFSVLHLLFNLAVTTDFGRRVEAGRGSLALALVVGLIAVVSNIGQYLVAENPLFGGLSGVAYGLLGYVLVSGRRFPAETVWRVHPSLAFSLLLFLLVFSTGVTEPFGLYVANTAHWLGLGSGALLALVWPAGAGRR